MRHVATELPLHEAQTLFEQKIDLLLAGLAPTRHYNIHISPHWSLTSWSSPGTLSTFTAAPIQAFPTFNTLSNATFFADAFPKLGLTS